MLCWSFSSNQYIKAAVANVEKYVSKTVMKLLKRAASPLVDGYMPELDTSEELDAEDASYYISLIGVLRWIVELGWVDIACEVSIMSSMMTLPRTGHLEKIFHMFAFLKIKSNSEMVFDLIPPDIDPTLFERQDWSHTVYGNKKERVSDVNDSEYVEPRGKELIIKAYADSDYAGEQKSRRSRTGFIVHLNNAYIYWYSKRQTGVETSSLGSKFIAMKQCCEYLQGLRFKLRSMGIHVSMSVLYLATTKRSW